MELSALLVMASGARVTAGGLLGRGWKSRQAQRREYNSHRSIVEEGVGKSIEVALGAIERLAAEAAHAPQDGASRPLAFH